MELEIDIDIAEPLAAFDELLNWRQRRNVLSSAKRAGGNVLRKRAAELAPVGSYPPHQIAAGRVPGRLKRSLSKVKTGLKITKRNKNVYVVAGLSDEDPYYASWVDQGHTIRKIRKGPVLGHVRGLKFMEQAAKDTEAQVFSAFRKQFVKMTYKQVAKAKARAASRRGRS